MSWSSAAHPLLPAQAEARPACFVCISVHHVYSLPISIRGPNNAEMPSQMQVAVVGDVYVWSHQLFILKINILRLSAFFSLFGIYASNNWLISLFSFVPCLRHRHNGTA